MLFDDLHDYQAKAPWAPAPRKGAAFTSRCPRCSASPGQACRDAQGQPLPGTHFQRRTERQKGIAAAMYLYAPLGRRP